MSRPTSRPARRLAIAASLVVAAGLLPAFAVGTAGAAAPAEPKGSAADDTPFAPAPRFTPGGAQVRVAPERYAATAVDLAAVRGTLADAPGVQGPRGPGEPGETRRHSSSTCRPPTATPSGSPSSAPR